MALNTMFLCCYFQHQHQKILGIHPVEKSVIDNILYDWTKKNLKTREDVDNYFKNKKDNKNYDETNVFDYNWLDDYDKQ